MDGISCGPYGHNYRAGVVDAPSRNVVLYSQGSTPFAPTHSFETVKDSQTGSESQVLRVTGMPVFRSGSFKDSMGDLTTWETLHIDQMVSSFQFLSDQKIFTDVPVREGHGSFFGDPMTGLVGYHDGLHAQDAQAPDGQTYRYLLADFSLMKPEAQQAYLSGLWRNRSSEVGFYESNNGTGYYPVYQGFAFVDIPAVEFLNQFAQEKKRSFSVLLDREIPMTLPVATPPAPQTLNPDGSAAPGGADPAPNSAPPAQHSAPVLPIPSATPPAPAPAPAANPPVVTPGVQAFSCDGKPVHDYAAVQAHISRLETENATYKSFQAETVRAGRIAFVNKLSADKKILASQVGSSEAGKESGIVGLVLGLDSAQFETWSKVYEAMPVNPLFSPQPTGGTGDPAETDLSQDEKDYAAAKAKVEWHRSGKMAKETLENTESYKTYARLHASLKKDGAL